MAPDKERQASVIDEEEIEITPEMIRAGQGVLFQYEEDDGSAATVRWIYEAMIRVARRSRAPTG